jgi:hypothetical protein
MSSDEETGTTGVNGAKGAGPFPVEIGDVTKDEAKDVDVNRIQRPKLAEERQRTHQHRGEVIDMGGAKPHPPPQVGTQRGSNHHSRGFGRQPRHREGIAVAIDTQCTKLRRCPQDV